MDHQESPSATRRGLLAGGNFIVDAVLTVDRYPEQDMLADIATETRTNGGGPYNVLCDLVNMGASFPLAAACLVGDDADGRWIREDCSRREIDITQVHVHPKMATSHTFVISAQATGRRTFLHHRGANRHLDRQHFDFKSSNARLFHLGYLLLLDALDHVDAEGRTGAAKLLQSAQEHGMHTSVDLVSVDNPNFQSIALSALPHVDHLFLNEIEAGRILGCKLAAHDRNGLESAARDLLAKGVHRTVAIHTEAGGVVVTPGDVAFRGSVILPTGFCRGTNGAGDAFAAGFLYGVHENWTPCECLELAICAAAASLSDPTPSAGLLPVDDCLNQGRRFGFSNW